MSQATEYRDRRDLPHCRRAELQRQEQHYVHLYDPLSDHGAPLATLRTAYGVDNFRSRYWAKVISNNAPNKR